MNGSAPGAPTTSPFNPVGLISSAIGGLWANRQRRKESRRQRQFQERMSSTAYQRQTKDLELAGLNRILGYTKGGPASTPAGSMAQLQDVITPAISTALQTRRLQQEIKNLQATEQLTLAKKDAIAPAAGVGKTLGGWIQQITNADWSAKSRAQRRTETNKAIKEFAARMAKKLRSGRTKTIHKDKKVSSYKGYKHESPLKIHIKGYRD